MQEIDVDVDVDVSTAFLLSLIVINNRPHFGLNGEILLAFLLSTLYFTSTTISLKHRTYRSPFSKKPGAQTESTQELKVCDNSKTQSNHKSA